MEYRYHLAQAQEEAGLGQAACYLCSRKLIEAQRRTFCNIRHIKEGIKGGATTHVEITKPDGSITVTPLGHLQITPPPVDQYCGARRELVTEFWNTPKLHNTKTGAFLNNWCFLACVFP